MSVNSQRFARPDSLPSDIPPPITIRYFYTAQSVIDDPLSPVPAPQPSTSTAANQPPRPFSTYDSATLDKVWNELRTKIRKYDAERAAEKRKKDQEGFERKEQPRRLSRASGQRSRPGSRQRPESRGETRVNGARSRAGSIDPPSRHYEPLDGEWGSDYDPEASGLTRMPFIRAPSRTLVSKFKNEISGNPQRPRSRASAEDIWSDSDELLDVDEGPALPKPTTKVPVGVSRLHQVCLPDLQMEPIYWLPVNDIGAVMRATWFYKENMLPVETEVANMLEAGYVSLRPWTQTWQDELSSATQIGAEGEMKVAHPLWPNLPESPGSRPGTALDAGTARAEITPEIRKIDALAAACDLIDANKDIAGGDRRAAGVTAFGRDARIRQYTASQVIYANGMDAYILRPSLQPSAYYGRRPYANYIRKGYQIGIHVVRGFDQQAWDKLHPPKDTKTEIRASEGASMAPLDWLTRHNTPQVTDLILVIHGIGQKLSERVESFHFTHAMNGFRREVNAELGNLSVKKHLRPDMGSIMLLPVNWRSALSFEEGGYRDEGDPALNQFSLSDITPDSLPSVRNIISDVMLDIPYYLSHHRPKMIAAVIKEANRVYKLWCQNNPNFPKLGRVHLLAHSLGSVMAIDILSDQPTHTEPQSNLQSSNSDFEQLSHFAFDTTNLFVCGSPTGFFLLLQKAVLLPRKNRNKPSAEGDDWSPGVAGEAGTYGCVAVDNIYNVINPYDPVAYEMNATVDVAYTRALKKAWIPSAAGSWFAMSNPFKSSSQPTPRDEDVAEGASKPIPAPTTRLPSTVELETHNFSREQLAETRMRLLNDNGQIDFWLRYGGGPLDIQYLTMLGAHSSYWLSKDFVRMIVLEVARRPGRKGVLKEMRAAKKKSAVIGGVSR